VAKHVLLFPSPDDARRLLHTGNNDNCGVLIDDSKDLLTCRMRTNTILMPNTFDVVFSALLFLCLC
jgi:hypothetical protein